MNSQAEFLWTWLVDFFVLATVVMIVGSLVSMAFRSPAWRLLSARACLFGLPILAIVVALPAWPRLSLQLTTLESPRQSVAQNPRTERDANDRHLIQAVAPPITPARNPNHNASPIQSQGEVRFGQSSPAEPFAISIPHHVGLAGLAIFLSSAAAVAVLLSIGGIRIRRVVSRSKGAPQRCYEILDSIVKGNREVTLLISTDIDQPMAIGLWKPRILLPARLSAMNASELRAAIAHEWSHLQRGDLWWLALNRLLMVVLFAHPCYWVLRRRSELDQELLADHAAAENGKHVEYAELLVRWARWGKFPRRSAHSLAMIGRPHRLKRRIHALLKNDGLPERRPRWLCTSSMFITATVLIGAVASVTMHVDGQPQNVPSATAPATGPSERATVAIADTMVPIKVSLPNGITLELVGVRDHPCVGHRQWRANGTLIPHASDDLTKLESRLGARIASELLVRMSNPQNVAIDWSDATATGAVEISPPSLTTNGTLAIPLISDASVATVRLEFGLGDWETISTSGCDLNARDARVCFAPCGDNPNTAVISIYHEQGKDTELRVLALDENGYEHEPSDVAYGKKEITATFHDLPMERVQEFFVQSRPHGWVEFRNVSLVPGQETTVEVATGAPG